MGIVEWVRSHMARVMHVLVVALAVMSLANAAALATHAPRSETVPKVPAAAHEAAPAASAPSTSTTAAPAPQTASGKAPTTKGKVRPTSTTQAGPPPVDELFKVMADGYQYEVTVTPECARLGEVITGRIRVNPHIGSAGSLMPFYADGSNEQGVATIAKPDGTLTYSWAARVVGEGRLVTQGMDGNTRQTGTKIVAFRVVEATGSC